MESTVAQIDALILTLQEAREDAAKVDAGKTGSPGTRVRKVAQEAKKSLDELRKSVVALRKGDEGDEGAE